MDKLLKAIKNLKIHGTVREEKEFDKFKLNILRELRDEEIFVLKKLKKHHVNSFKHSMMVARDVDYITDQMNLPEDKRRALRIAAILHDVGKLDIHESILDLRGYKERVKIWTNTYPNKQLPKGPLLNNITVKQIIEYKSKKAEHPKKYIKHFKIWLKDKGIYDFWRKSLLEYLRHHQHGTRKILNGIGVNSKWVEYAAGHHPDYFDDKDKHKLPKECRIIEIADKFNAITQSEGIRHYFRKKTRTEALDIIAKQLKKEYSGIFKGYERKSLKYLIKKYLPLEVHKELIPETKKIIHHLQKNIDILRKSKDNTEKDNAKKYLMLLTITIVLSKEFSHALDHATIQALKHYKNELSNLLSKCSEIRMFY